MTSGWTVHSTVRSHPRNCTWRLNYPSGSPSRKLGGSMAIHTHLHRRDNIPFPHGLGRSRRSSKVQTGKGPPIQDRSDVIPFSCNRGPEKIKQPSTTPFFSLEKKKMNPKSIAFLHSFSLRFVLFPIWSLNRLEILEFFFNEFMAKKSPVLQLQTTKRT